MNHKSVLLYARCITIALVLLCPALTVAQTPAIASRITQAVDETRLTTLRGNTHPLARAQFDRGAAPPSLPMERMLLVLRRSPEQETALDALLDQQQDNSSPNYHQWLTPDQFGQQFGPSDQDVQAITSWLRSHGFRVAQVSRGRTSIEFSGTASQVQEAFHTAIHRYNVNGEDHWANSSDPQIPVALATVVAGVNTLHNFPREAMHHVAGLASRSKSTGKVTLAQPSLYSLGGECGVPGVGCNAVGPFDFATIYNLLPLWNATPTHIDGTGQTIAIVGESDINPTDVAAFRTYFGLPASSIQVIVNGPDPGIQLGDETESDLDVEWAGAVAPGANVDFVVSQTTEASLGVDLSAEYIVDNNLAPILSESYGICELFLGSAGNQFYNQLWQQAAAQGITVLVATGDSGSAVCDRNAALGTPAQLGLSVSGISSTPYNVAVGGTDFNDLATPSTYWAATNSAPPAPGSQSAIPTVSALSYIPETTWNDTCTNGVFGTLLGFSTNAETNCNNPRLIQEGFTIPVGGSGGASNCTISDGRTVSTCSGGYSKPSWQTGAGVPDDGKRDVPDVSLFAAINSPSGSFYVVCEADFNPGSVSCDPSNPNTEFLGVGGTSASTPALAGIMALVNQQTQSRQGNANYVFYQLATQQPGAFHDVPVGGTIAMPCVTGSTSDCITQQLGDPYGVLSGYSTTSGYDLATGLGSVNANSLVAKWSTVASESKQTAVTLTLSPTSSPVVHGTMVPLAITVTPNPASSGTPTGEVSLITSDGQTAGSFTLGGGGSISSGTNQLPGGDDGVRAFYEGDATFRPGQSSMQSIQITPEPSTASVSVLTGSSQNSLTPFATGPYGTPTYLRSTVTGLSGVGIATGRVNFTRADGTFIADADLDYEGVATTQNLAPIMNSGAYSIVANYIGDSSFQSSSSAPTNLQLTIAPTTTSIQLPNGPFDEGATLSINVVAAGGGSVPNGNITLFSDGTQIGIPVFIGGGDSSVNTVLALGSITPQLPLGPNVLTVQYSGNANYLPSASAPANVDVLAPTTIAVTASATTIQQGQSVTFTAQVKSSLAGPQMTGNVQFSTGSAASGPVSISSSGQATFTTASLPLGSPPVTANYSGDMDYAPAFGLVSVTVNAAPTPTFAVTANPTAIVVSAPGQAGSTVLTFTSQNGLTGTNLTVAAACTGLPLEATCSFNPTATVTSTTITLPSNGSTTATFYVLTTAPSSAVPTANNRPGGFGRWTIREATTLAFATCIVTLLLGFRRKQFRRSTAFAVLAFAFIIATAACGGGGGSNSGGGGSGGGGGNPTNPGTPLTQNAPINVSLTVSGVTQAVPNLTVTVQ